jgi:hypothetical protein
MWLKHNYTTLAMALVLSLMTVGLLTEPGEDNPPVTVYAKFEPRVLAEVGSLQYRVEGKLLTGSIPVLVSGDPAQVQAVHLTLNCRPTLDESKFDQDISKFETSVQVTPEDFDLPPVLAKRITIRPVTVAITYARLVPATLPVKASIADVQDAGIPVPVDAVTVEPRDQGEDPGEPGEPDQGPSHQAHPDRGPQQHVQGQGEINTELRT